VGPLAILSFEHELIGQFLEHLDLALRRLMDGHRLPREFFDKVVVFARGYVGEYHHLKEEHQMFAMLADRSDPEIQQSLDALRRQHDRGRDYIDWVEADLDGYEAGDPAKTARIIENLGSYLSMLTAHIVREEEMFFPLVEETLCREEKRALLRIFKESERRYCDEVLERNLLQLREMAYIMIDYTRHRIEPGRTSSS